MKIDNRISYRIRFIFLNAEVISALCMYMILCFVFMIYIFTDIDKLTVYFILG